MSGYGNRYLTSSSFASYCSGLNVAKLSNSELEHYEQEGVLLPAARIVTPKEYVARRKLVDTQTNTYANPIPGWEELERVLFPQMNPELWHPFDWEFKQSNKFLRRPSGSDFKPWASYKTEMKSRTAESYQVSTVENYYHYWQVHQIYKIRKDYPVFAKYPWLLKHLKEGVENNVASLKPQLAEPRIFRNAKYFDSLSFFIILYTNQRHQTFDSIPMRDGVKQLNDLEFATYEQQQIAHAMFVSHRYSLTTDQLYDFLVELLELQDHYQRDEKMKLAQELGNDISYLAKFITCLTGSSFSEIEEQVDRRAGIWIRQQLRHQDQALKVYDYARQTFERLINTYNSKFINFNMSFADIDNLLEFIEEKRLFVIPYALFDIDESLKTPKTFRWTSLYIGLSNLSTGFECYLRELANIVNHSSSNSIRTDNLFNMIQDMFPQWGGLFQREHQKRADSNQNSYQPDDISYIEDICTTPGLSSELRAFLVSYKARNFMAHNYTIEPYFYRNLYGIVYSEICHSIFYSWKYMSQRGLV